MILYQDVRRQYNPTLQMDRVFAADRAAWPDPAVILDGNSKFVRPLSPTGDPRVPSNFYLTAKRNMRCDFAGYLTCVMELDTSPLACEGIRHGQPPGVEFGQQTRQISLAILRGFLV
jgi:hypothetical protein